jgi:hypothetical protein
MASDSRSTIELVYTKDVYDRDTENGIYKVKRIVNSLNYKPGDFLDEKEVSTLVKHSRFKVVIT